MAPATIGSRTIRTCGHTNGGHGAIVFAIERKNELSATSCEPTVKLAPCNGEPVCDGISSKYCGDLFTGWSTLPWGSVSDFHTGFARTIDWIPRPLCSILGNRPAQDTTSCTLSPALQIMEPQGNWHSRNDIFLAFRGCANQR
jgi:hypothetical protein